jgi:hypothetical protein
MIVVVSGLPRSGTSMLMQMLAAGGMPLLTDGIRRPDTDNPKGYFEFEPVKRLKTDASWLNACNGKAVKIVSQLLYDLPPVHDYAIVFMKRDLREVLASQRAMLKRLGRVGAGLSDVQMAQKFRAHLQKLDAWVRRQENMTVMDMLFGEVVQSPRRCARRLCRFLGRDLDADQMAQVVEKRLHRQRKAPMTVEGAAPR